jgi:hypothetical protein
MRPLRLTSLLAVSSLACIAAAAIACSSSSSDGGGAPATSGTGPDAGAGVAFDLDGVYVATDPDAGATDPADLVGDVWRFHDGAYSVHPLACPTETDESADSGIAFGDDDAGDDDTYAFFPPDFTGGASCDSSGTFAISADGTSLALTDGVTGMTTTESFVPLQWLPPEGGEDDAGAGDGDAGAVVGQSLPGRLAHAVGGLVTPGGAVVKTSDVTLVNAGGKLLTAAGCSGVSAASGAATGAFVRLASDVGFSCLQTQLTLPAFDIPAGPDGGAYCTQLGGSCTTENYYGRHGVGFIYDEFLGGGNPAECGFEYMPGAETTSGKQGSPRWVPYVRGDSGYYRYGQTSDGSITGYPAGSAVTLLCTVDSGGHLQMKINGSLIYDANAPHALLSSPQSFDPSATHVMRVTAIAWPETLNKTAAQIATLKANHQFFPPYTCQPLDKLQVTYTSSVACSTGSGSPDTPYTCGSSGETWKPSATGIGYTLTPSSEVTDVPSGSACTDTLFPGGN